MVLAVERGAERRDVAVVSCRNRLGGIGIVRHGETLDEHMPCVNARFGQHVFRKVHERPRPADEEIAFGVRARERRDGIGVDQPASRVEMVMAVQPAGKPGVELVELAPEDDPVAIRIGVEKARRQHGLMQGLLDQRDHRRDAAAAGEQHGRPVPAAQNEATAGRRDIDDVARFRDVVEPVGADSVADPLDRNLELGVAGWRARQRVAALDPAVLPGNAKRQELPGPVGEQRRMLAIRPELERACVHGLIDDLAYRERIKIHQSINASGIPSRAGGRVRITAGAGRPRTKPRQPCLPRSSAPALPPLRPPARASARRPGNGYLRTR